MDKKHIPLKYCWFLRISPRSDWFIWEKLRFWPLNAISETKKNIFDFSFGKIGWSDLDQIWTRGVFYYYLDKYHRIFEKNENCHNGGHFRPKMAAIFTKMVKILDKNGRHFGNFHFFQKFFGTYLDNDKIHLWSNLVQIGPPYLPKTDFKIYFFLSQKSRLRG